MVGEVKLKRSLGLSSPLIARHDRRRRIVDKLLSGCNVLLGSTASHWGVMKEKLRLQLLAVMKDRKLWKSASSTVTSVLQEVSKDFEMSLFLVQRMDALLNVLTFHEGEQFSMHSTFQILIYLKTAAKVRRKDMKKLVTNIRIIRHSAWMFLLRWTEQHYTVTVDEDRSVSEAFVDCTFQCNPVHVFRVWSVFSSVLLGSCWVQNPFDARRIFVL